MEIEPLETETAATTAYDSDSASYYAATLTSDLSSMTEEEKTALVEGWLEDGLGSSWADQGFQSDYYCDATVAVMAPSGDWYEGGPTTSYMSDTVASNFATYYSSNFYGNEADLMDSVDGVTEAFGFLIDYLKDDDESAAEYMASLLGYDTDSEEWEEFCETYGLDMENLDDLSGADVANAMVLAMADSISTDYDSDSIKNMLNTLAGTASDDYDGNWEASDFASLTMWYAVCAAYAESDYASSDFVSYYESFCDSASSADSGTEAMTYMFAMLSYLAEDEGDAEDGSGGFVNYVASGEAQTDSEAFVSLMSILTEVSTSDEDFDFDTASIEWGSDIYSYLKSLMSNYENY